MTEVEFLDTMEGQDQAPPERLDLSVPYMFLLDAKAEKFPEICQALPGVASGKNVVMRSGGKWHDLGNEIEGFVVRYDHYYAMLDFKGALTASRFSKPTTRIKDWVDCFLVVLLIDSQEGLLPVKFTARRGLTNAIWQIIDSKIPFADLLLKLKFEQKQGAGNAYGYSTAVTTNRPGARADAIKKAGVVGGTEALDRVIDDVKTAMDEVRKKDVG